MNTLPDILVDVEEEAKFNEKRTALGRLPGEDELNVRFFMMAVKNKQKTEAEGRPIYEEVEFINISTPEDPLTEITTYVQPEHMERFPREYEAFKANVVAADAGTPLEQWPGLPTATRAELKALKINTVEALANLSDRTAQKHMGLLELKKKAQNYLEATKAEAIATKSAETASRIEQLELEKNRATAETADLRREMEELKAMLKAQVKKGADKAE